jgi:hypothetical protein
MTASWSTGVNSEAGRREADPGVWLTPFFGCAPDISGQEQQFISWKQWNIADQAAPIIHSGRTSGRLPNEESLPCATIHFKFDFMDSGRCCAPGTIPPTNSTDSMIAVAPFVRA